CSWNHPRNRVPTYVTCRLRESMHDPDTSPDGLSPRCCCTYTDLHTPEPSGEPKRDGRVVNLHRCLDDKPLAEAYSGRSEWTDAALALGEHDRRRGSRERWSFGGQRTGRTARSRRSPAAVPQVCRGVRDPCQRRTGQQRHTAAVLFVPGEPGRAPD